MAETIRRMHAERCGCDVKKRIVRPDGEIRYIRCVGIPVIEDEVLKGFLGSAMDITEQELLTRELERREAYLAEAQALSQTGSAAFNDTTILYWSMRLIEFSGSISVRASRAAKLRWKGFIRTIENKRGKRLGKRCMRREIINSSSESCCPMEQSSTLNRPPTLSSPRAENLSRLSVQLSM